MSFGIIPGIPSFSADVVAIFKQSDEGNDEQILEGAHLIQATVNEYVSFFSHPLENGRSLVDHRIIQPVTIDLRVILVDRSPALLGDITGTSTRASDVYKEMRDVFLAGTLLRIQTRARTYSNQLVQAIPHEETSAMFGGIALSFNTSEIQFETDNVATAEQEKDSDLISRGKQNPIALGTKVVSTVRLAVATIFGN